MQRRAPLSLRAAGEDAILEDIIDIHERRSAALERVRSHVDRRRLLETAEALIELPSPTGRAKGGRRSAGADSRTRRVPRRAAGWRLPGGSGGCGSARKRKARADASIQRPPRHGPSAVLAAARREGRAHRQRGFRHEGGNRRGRGSRACACATPVALRRAPVF